VGVTYKPDRDAPVLHSTVPVTVTPGQSRLVRLAVPAGLAVVLVAAAAVVWRRRNRAAGHAELPR
jgi:hypothetical protein